MLPCVAADDWGSSVNGLRIGIAIKSGLHPEIRIAVRNVDDSPVLLTFGSLIGPRFYDLRFRVSRIDPLVVPLIPGARYTVRIPLASFSVLDESENLETFILRRCKVRVELEVRNPTCPLYGTPTPT
jgi:hypothetical protein